MSKNLKKLFGVLVAVLLVLGMTSIALADQVSITGMIVQSGDRYMLDTGAKKIILDCAIGANEVNQRVKVTGNLKTDGNGNEVLTEIEDIQPALNNENPQWS